MTSEPNRNGRATHRTLVLSWHPEDGYLSAGGYRRSREVVRGLACKSEVVVIDVAPSIYGDLRGPSLRIVEYSLPRLKRVASVDRRLARFVQWSLAAAMLMWDGVREERRLSFDSIYVPTSDVLVCAVAGAALKVLTRRRLVFCNMNAVAPVMPLVMRALHERADAVTVLSQAEAAALAGWPLRTPILVAGTSGPPFDDDVPSTQPDEKVWDGIFIGRHTPEKGVFDALEVWERVLRKRPEARLLLIGACSTEIRRKLEERMADLPIGEGQIVLGGVVPDREKFALLRRSRVAIATSHVEGWGFIPLEALGVGVPTVCWDLAAYWESAPASEHILRIPRGDIETFAEAVIDTIVADPQIAINGVGPRPQASWNEVNAREWSAVSGRVP